MLAQTQQELEAERAENRNLQREMAALRSAPKHQFPNLDIVIALDTTSSMRQQVAGLRSEIVQFTRLLRKLSPSLGVGAIAFRDRCEGQNAVREFPLRPMHETGLNQLIAFANTMRAGSHVCNQDQPEALAAALERAVAANWRRASEARYIVLITDNPPYEHRKQASLAAARAFAASGDESKVSVVIGGNDVDFLRNLAATGDGVYVRAGASFTASLLLALLP